MSGNHGNVSPISPDLNSGLSNDGVFSTLEVSPEQRAREFAAARNQGLELTPKSDGKEVIEPEVGKQVVADDGKETAVGLGLFPEEIDRNHKRIFGIPKWAFWSLLVFIVIALAVGLGAGISIHNNKTHDAALAASKASASLAAAHSTSSTTSSRNDTLTSSTSSNSSSISTSTSTKPPITLCGDCFFVYGVGSHIWWSSILTSYISTLIISVDTSRKTVSTSFKKNSISNSYTGASFTQNITQYVNASDFGFAATSTVSHNWVEYSIVNQTTDTAFLSTQTNYFEDLQYYWKTLYVNNSIPSNGTGNYGPTECNQALSTPSGTFVATTGTAPVYSDLPGATIVYYTTLVPFNATFNFTDWETVGLGILGARLSVVINQVFGTTCTYYGGGFATVQVAVVTETLTLTSTLVAAKTARHVAVATTLAQAPVTRRGFDRRFPSSTAKNRP